MSNKKGSHTYMGQTTNSNGTNHPRSMSAPFYSLLGYLVLIHQNSHIKIQKLKMVHVLLTGRFVSDPVTNPGFLATRINVSSSTELTWEQNELRCEKTGLRGFRPGLTQTRL